MRELKKEIRGFTLIELMVVMGVFLILLALSWVNFTALPTKFSGATFRQTLMADIKATQTQTMSGDTGTADIQSDYGIRFDSGGYTLFKGASYSAGDPANFRVDLPDANLSFTDITFPGQSLIFVSGTGEVKNYAVNQDSLTLTDSLTNQNTIIRINKYGAQY